MKFFTQFALLATLVLAVACNRAKAPATEGATPESAAPAAAAPAAAPAARVFFVEPTDGATVTSPVALKFGIENYTLDKVPEGEVTTVREGVGHHHVGVDQDCLPAGTNIVKGTPSWIHFGGGQSDMTPGLQLTPGQHKLSLQLADDKHNAIDSLCQTITITVK